MPSPGVIAAVLFVLGILNFKEVRNNIASPLILMMAGVIGVAGAWRTPAPPHGG